MCTPQRRRQARAIEQTVNLQVGRETTRQLATCFHSATDEAGSVKGCLAVLICDSASHTPKFHTAKWWKIEECERLATKQPLQCYQACLATKVSLGVRLGGARVCAEFFMLGSLKFTRYEYYWIFIVQRGFCQSSWPIHFKLHVKIFKKQDCRKFTPNKSTAYVPIQVSLMWTIVIVIAHTMAGMKINIISRSRMETRQVRIKCWI